MDEAMIGRWARGYLGQWAAMDRALRDRFVRGLRELSRREERLPPRFRIRGAISEGMVSLGASTLNPFLERDREAASAAAFALRLIREARQMQHVRGDRRSPRRRHTSSGPGVVDELMGVRLEYYDEPDRFVGLRG